MHHTEEQKLQMLLPGVDQVGGGRP